VLHVLTHKGRGYAPAEEDEVQCLHDVKAMALPKSTSAPVRVAAHPAPPPAPDRRAGAPGPDDAPSTYTDAFSRALIRIADRRHDVVALTAAMPGPTGLLPFQARFPDRFFDVGIAEQHEVTAAAGMAMGGLHPVVAVYSTFLSRAFDQMNLDVALHRLPVVFALDRAGITGDNGPSHHGIFDLVLSLAVPGMTVLAPSSAEDLEAMLETAVELAGPVTIRYPSTPARHAEPGHGLEARLLRQGDGSVCLLGVGKLVAACEAAVAELEATGIDATLWDVRSVCPPDERMITDAMRHGLVVTAEDGLRTGGAGTFLSVEVARAADEADRSAPPVVSLGIPRAFLPQDKPDAILADLGLDGPGIAASVRRMARRGVRTLFAP
jgi:1-deoxy-D-xylulose-5-phosphate synthase